MGDILCGCCCACRKEGNGTVQPPDYSPDFKGPIRGKSRRPKDLLCLIGFVAFIVGMFSIGIYSWINGTPSRLLYSVDSNGRLCGFTEGVKNKPNLLFFDYTKCIRRVSTTDLLSGNFETSDLFTCPTQQVCIEECPTENEVGIRQDPICVDGVDTAQFSILNSTDPTDSLEVTAAVAKLVELIVQEKCAPYYITSEAVAGRCIPTFANLDSLIDLVNNTNNFNESDVPDLTELVFELTLTEVLNGTLTQALFLNAQVLVFGILQDLEVVWPAILIGSGITLVLCFIYVVLMRLFSGVVVCTGIIAGLLFIAAFSGFSFFQFYCFEVGSLNIPSVADGIVNASTVQEFLNTTEDFAAKGCRFTDPLRDFFDANAPWYEYQKETWLTLGVVSFVILVVLIFLLILFIKRIWITIQIIKEASKAVGYIPGVVLYPIVTWTLITITTGYWAVVAVFLYTASEPEYVITNGANDTINNVTNSSGTSFIAGEVCNPNDFNGDLGSNNSKLVYDVNTMTNITVSCLFNRFFVSNFLIYLQLYMLFGLLWVCNYIIALGECTIAGSFASYYWAWNKSKDIGLFTTPASFARAILFHSGSLAFGALIIAIIQIIRAILAYIQKKLKQNKESKIAHAILTCLQCCFFLLEKVFKYINRHAYIEIAIYGYDFCTGACHAIKLILRNVITTAIKDRIVGLLLFMGKVMIVGLIAFVGYLGFGPYEEQGRVLWQRELNYYLIPLIILIVLAFFISSGFMSVYEMGVDTIFICALEDQERNNGFDKPYYMSKNLQKLMGVHNRFKEGTDGEGDDSPDQPLRMQEVNNRQD